MSKPRGRRDARRRDAARAASAGAPDPSLSPPNHARSAPMASGDHDPAGGTALAEPAIGSAATAVPIPPRRQDAIGTITWRGLRRLLAGLPVAALAPERGASPPDEVGAAAGGPVLVASAASAAAAASTSSGRSASQSSGKPVGSSRKPGTARAASAWSSFGAGPSTASVASKPSAARPPARSSA